MDLAFVFILAVAAIFTIVFLIRLMHYSCDESKSRRQILEEEAFKRQAEKRESNKLICESICKTLKYSRFSSPKTPNVKD